MTIPDTCPEVPDITSVIVTQNQTTFLSGLDLSEYPNAQFLSWLDPPEAVGFSRLPSPAYLGVLLTAVGQHPRQLFLPNLEFLEFLHQRVAEIMPTLPGLRESYRHRRTGTIFLVDQRFEAEAARITDNDLLPREEIIGVFGIEDGEISASSYRRSTAYAAWTRWGRSRLLPFLRPALVERLRGMPIPAEMPLPRAQTRVH